MLFATTAWSQPAVMIGASIGAGFSRGVQREGLTGSLAGNISIRSSDWILSSNAVEFLLLANENEPDPFDGGTSSSCRDANGRPLVNARCNGVGTRNIYSPTIELGRATRTRFPVQLTAGYRFGALGGAMGALALLSGQQDRSHSYLRLAGGRNHVVLSMGVSIGRYAGSWQMP